MFGLLSFQTQPRKYEREILIFDPRLNNFLRRCVEGTLWKGVMESKFNLFFKEKCSFTPEISVRVWRV